MPSIPRDMTPMGIASPCAVATWITSACMPTVGIGAPPRVFALTTSLGIGDQHEFGHDTCLLYCVQHFWKVSFTYPQCPLQ